MLTSYFCFVHNLASCGWFADSSPAAQGRERRSDAGYRGRPGCVGINGIMMDLPVIFLNLNSPSLPWTTGIKHLQTSEAPTADCEMNVSLVRLYNAFTRLFLWLGWCARLGRLPPPVCWEMPALVFCTKPHKTCVRGLWVSILEHCVQSVNVYSWYSVSSE